MADDLLAGSEPAPEAAAPPPEDSGVDPSPVDHGLNLADWVPSELHDPARREDLLRGVGLDPEAMKNTPSERPEGFPEKFWEEGKGPRLESLAKSYTELERKLHESGKAGPPETYEIEAPEGVEVPEGESVLSEEDVKLFKELGLDNDGAQKLVKHFWEQVIPVVSEQQMKVEQEKLAGAWGMKTDSTEFTQRTGAVKQWAEQNLPKEVQDHLRSSANGVLAMWGMMNTRRPPGDSSPPAPVTPQKIQEMVAHPDYWDESKPEYRRQVQEMVERMGG